MRRSNRLSVRGTVSALYRGPANPWPFIFDGIRNDLLPVVRIQSGRWLDSLHVEDFKPWIDFCRDLPTANDAPDYTIDCEEVGFHLDLSTSAVIAKLGAFYRAREITTMRRLTNFRAAYVSIREVFNLLAINGRWETELNITRLLNKANVKCCDQQKSFRLRQAVNFLNQKSQKR